MTLTDSGKAIGGKGLRVCGERSVTGDKRESYRRNGMELTKRKEISGLFLKKAYYERTQKMGGSFKPAVA